MLYLRKIGIYTMVEGEGDTQADAQRVAAEKQTPVWINLTHKADPTAEGILFLPNGTRKHCSYSEATNMPKSDPPRLDTADERNQKIEDRIKQLEHEHGELVERVKRLERLERNKN